MVDDGGEAGAKAVGDLGVGGGEDDVADGFDRDAVVPLVEPDERLSLGRRPIRAGMHVDGLIDLISPPPRARPESSPWDRHAGRLISPRGGRACRAAVRMWPRQAADGQCKRGEHRLEKCATMAHYMVLQGSARFYKVLQGSTGFSGLLQGSSGFQVQTFPGGLPDRNDADDETRHRTQSNRMNLVCGTRSDPS